MNRRLVITGAALAAATLCLAFAAWVAEPGQWRTVLAILAAVSGVGVVAVWFIAGLSGRNGWIVTCLATSVLALACGLYEDGPTLGVLLLGLTFGPVLASAIAIREATWWQWPGWSKPRRKAPVRKSRAHHSVAEGAAAKTSKDNVEARR
jgi:hypothetical protein